MYCTEVVCSSNIDSVDMMRKSRERGVERGVCWPWKPRAVSSAQCEQYFDLRSCAFGCSGWASIDKAELKEWYSGKASIKKEELREFLDLLDYSWEWNNCGIYDYTRGTTSQTERRKEGNKENPLPKAMKRLIFLILWYIVTTLAGTPGHETVVVCPTSHHFLFKKTFTTSPLIKHKAKSNSFSYPPHSDLRLRLHSSRNIRQRWACHLCWKAIHQNQPRSRGQLVSHHNPFRLSPRTCEWQI